MRSRRSAWVSVCAAVSVTLTGLLAACGGTVSTPQAQTHLSPYPVSTITYLPPTVVLATPRVPATPTPHPTSQPAPPPTPTIPAGPNPVGGVPNTGGQLLLVSLSQQWLWAYQNGRLVYRTPITSGMPQLPTPDGIYHIQFHQADLMFISPWPLGSPYYYAPEHVNYAMYFLDDGYYVHDAPWRKSYYGPGTNYPHVNPDGVTRTGSHGCVEVPTSAGVWLYYWTANGATIDIYGAAPVPSAAPALTATPTRTPTPTPTFTPTATPTSTATGTPTTERANRLPLA